MFNSSRLLQILLGFTADKLLNEKPPFINSIHWKRLGDPDVMLPVNPGINRNLTVDHFREYDKINILIFD
jgi:hypothetical protein